MRWTACARRQGAAGATSWAPWRAGRGAGRPWCGSRRRPTTRSSRCARGCWRRRRPCWGAAGRVQPERRAWRGGGVVVVVVEAVNVI
ncbi:hypothetical protein BDU57DRAFT_518157 [Ampelomyces quisqualis]|uniref:Uncharacterized protein n=1 Tax=Ampelomyces quisqualis TaxID=50730 RepID=A0A6A5QKA9_AMPQU|nr:hypothetical protein BDU57DRAFT_518157 [Ampelomyces quisqualis]